MTDIIVDGNTKVWYVPQLTDMSKPDPTELESGTMLEDRVLANGFQPADETATVEAPKLGSDFMSRYPGRLSSDVTLLLAKQQDDGQANAAWQTLDGRPAGYLAVRVGKPHDEPWTEGDEVMVWKGKFGDQMVMAPEANFVFQWQVKFFGEDRELHGSVATAA